MTKFSTTANQRSLTIRKFGRNFSKEHFAFGTSVQITNVCNYLGIFVDNKLAFKFHIEHVCKN